MTFPQIPVNDLPDDAVMLDIRKQDEWNRGHAPGAIHMPMDDLPSRLDELAPLLSSGAPLIVACRSGGRVLQVLPWLAQQGYEAANLYGGMLAWQAAGKPMKAAHEGAPSIT